MANFCCLNYVDARHLSKVMSSRPRTSHLEILLELTFTEVKSDPRKGGIP